MLDQVFYLFRIQSLKVPWSFSLALLPCHYFSQGWHDLTHHWKRSNLNDTTCIFIHKSFTVWAGGFFRFTKDSHPNFHVACVPGLKTASKLNCSASCGIVPTSKCGVDGGRIKICMQNDLQYWVPAFHLHVWRFFPPGLFGGLVLDFVKNSSMGNFRPFTTPPPTGQSSLSW